MKKIITALLILSSASLPALAQNNVFHVVGIGGDYESAEQNAIDSANAQCAPLRGVRVSEFSDRLAPGNIAHIAEADFICAANPPSNPEDNTNCEWLPHTYIEKCQLSN